MLLYHNSQAHTTMASITMKANSFFLLLSFFFSLSLPISTTASSNVSAIFAFGDSTIDSGNNNRFNTLFRGDHLPYGRDFPNHVPTGRFSNGKISTDYLANILGIKDVLPAYLDPHVTDQDLLTGVSFGSGGSGLDTNTVALARVLDLSTQFQLFEESFQRIRRVVGDEKANNIIQNALFVISIGTNDMLYNAYLLPARMIRYGSISRYQDFLLQNLQSFIQVNLCCILHCCICTIVSYLIHTSNFSHHFRLRLVDYSMQRLNTINKVLNCSDSCNCGCIEFTTITDHCRKI